MDELEVVFILKQRASKILIFLILLSLCTSYFATSLVKAQEDTDPATNPEATGADTTGTMADQAFVINKDWLDISAVSFGGNAIDSGGKYGRLNVDVGGYGMTNFINHGEIAYDEETDIHVYMASMNFPYSTVVYTDAMIDDCYSHSTGVGEIEWLHLKTFTSWYWKSDMRSNHYYAKPSYIGIHDVDTQEYDGNLRLNVKVNPVLPIEEGDIITMNGLEFVVPNIRIFIDSAMLINKTYGVCDDPKNFYTDNAAGVIEVRKENLASTYISGLSDDDAENQCDDGWDDNAGVPYGSDEPTAEDVIDSCGVHNRIRYYGVTYTSGEVGQAYISTPTEGATWSRSNDLNDNDDVFEFDSHIRIKPNIFYDMETYEVKHKKVTVDRYKEALLPDYGLCDVDEEHTDKYSRIVGLGVQNLFTKLTYNMKVVMLLSIVPTGEEGETMLEDPEIYQGDIVWDNTILGTTEVDQTITESPSWVADTDDWFENLLEGIGDWFSGIGDWFDNLLGGIGDWWSKFGFWIIIIIAIVVVVIVLFVIMRIIPKRNKYGQPSNVVISGAEKKKTHR